MDEQLGGLGESIQRIKNALTGGKTIQLKNLDGKKPKVLCLLFCHGSAHHLLNNFSIRTEALREYLPQVEAVAFGLGNDWTKQQKFKFNYLDFKEIDPLMNHVVAQDLVTPTIERLIIQHRPDLVYLRYPYFKDQALVQVAKKYGNFILEHHTKEIEEFKLGSKRRELEAELDAGTQLLNQAVGIVAVTEDILNYEQQRIHTPLPGLVLTNGISNVGQLPLSLEPPQNSIPRIVVVASFNPWHGLDLLIRGMAKPNAPKVQLEVIGQGNTLKQYQNLVLELGLSTQVVFHGVLEPEQISIIARGVTLAVGTIAAYRNNLEATVSLKHREYAQRGLPFIHSGDPDFDSHPEWAKKITSKEVPIDIQSILDFAFSFWKNKRSLELRNYCNSELSWKKKAYQLAEFLCQNDFTAKSKETPFNTLNLRMGVIAHRNNVHFLQSILDNLKDTVKVEIADVNNQVSLSKVINDNDMLWLEWADHPNIEISKLPQINKKRVILRLHSYEYFMGKYQGINWESIDDLILVGENIRDAILNDIPNLEHSTKIHVLHNAIDTHKFPIKKDKIESKKIAFVASIRHCKNYPLLFQIFYKINQLDPEYSLHIAGEYQANSNDMLIMENKELDLYLQNVMNHWGFKDKVIFHGQVNDMNSWLEDKDVLLCTSIREGMPVNVIEAMSKGIKPIIHDFPGAKYFYPDNLIYKSVDEAVEMVFKPTENAEYYRSIVEEKWSVDIHQKKLLEILRNTSSLVEVNKDLNSKNKSIKDRETLPKILFIARGNPNFRNFYTKFDAQSRALLKVHPNSVCAVIGWGSDWIDQQNFCFHHIDLRTIEPNANYEEIRDLFIDGTQLMIRKFNPEMVFMRYPYASQKLLNLVSEYPNIVFEHHAMEEQELLAHNSPIAPIEKNLGWQILNKAAGTVGVTREIAEYERFRSRKNLPILTLGNGIDAYLFPQVHPQKSLDTFNMLYVSYFALRHGVERLIKGLLNYNGTQKIHIHMVGAGELPPIQQAIDEAGLSKMFTFYGYKDPSEITPIISKCQMALGTLAQHRQGLKEVVALKHREYSSRGIPFVHAGDPDFNDLSELTMRVPNDETPLNIHDCIKFSDTYWRNGYATKMRNFAENQLSWHNKMKIAADFISNIHRNLGAN